MDWRFTAYLHDGWYTELLRLVTESDWLEHTYTSWHYRMDPDSFVAYRLTLYEMSSFDFAVSFLPGSPELTGWSRSTFRKTDVSELLKFPRFMWYPKVDYCVQERLATGSSDEPLKSNPLLPPHFLKTHFSIILASIATWSVWFLPFRCTNQNITYLCMPSVPAACSTAMVVHELTVLIQGCW